MRAMFGVFLLLCLAFTVGGCSTVKGDPYVPGEIQVQGVQLGTITHVGASSVTSEPTIVGPVIGGVTGALIGGVIGGSGSAGVVGALAGGTLGAVAGGLGEMGFRTTNYGLALTVELDSGKTVIVAQPEDDIYTIGDRVRVMRDKEGYGRVQLQ